MKLYILRHGDAVEHGDPRFRENDRPLTPKGIQRTKELAHALREMEISFDAILSSPLVRARETAEIVVRGLKSGKVELTEHLTPSGSMDALVKQVNMLRPLPKNILLVGHEPYLSGLISLLCTGGPGLLLAMKKGGLCRLEIESPARCDKCATLEWLLTPRVISLKPSKR
jgi:phosphohistidine phosphatase